MALILETGAGIPAANAFVTRAEADTYFGDYGGFWTGADADKDSAIIRASLWLSSYPIWNGKPTYGRAGQGLSLPRTGMTDCNGEDVPDNEIPNEVKIATFIAASYELANPGALTPNVMFSERVRREKVDVIEVEYMTAADQGLDPKTLIRPMLTQIEDLLRCFTSFGRLNVPHPFVA